jgi:hypothetical protein
MARKNTSKPIRGIIFFAIQGNGIAFTYCCAGALCWPPLNPAGRTAYDAFPAPPPPIGPRLRSWEPDVPVCEEILNSDSSAQHSSVERWFFAARVVMFKVLAAARPARKLERKERGPMVIKLVNDK